MNTLTGKDGGRYYVIDEEKRLFLPSVTTIIGAMSDKSGIEEWKARIGEEEADIQSKFAANRGTFMHALHEKFIDFSFINRSEKPLQSTFVSAKSEFSSFSSEELECGKKLFLQFLNQTDFYKNIDSILFQEIPLWSFSGGGYAGRMDLAIIDKTKSIKIIDFKTSKKLKKEEWIDGYKKQIAAYSIALYERKGIFPTFGEIWISCESGEIQTFSMNKQDIKDWFREFYQDVINYHKTYKNQI